MSEISRLAPDDLEAPAKRNFISADRFRAGNFALVDKAGYPAEQ
jgi:hypothetical protein